MIGIRFMVIMGLVFVLGCENKKDGKMMGQNQSTRLPGEKFPPIFEDFNLLHISPADKKYFLTIFEQLNKRPINDRKKMYFRLFAFLASREEKHSESFIYLWEKAWKENKKDDYEGVRIFTGTTDFCYPSPEQCEVSTGSLASRYFRALLQEKNPQALKVFASYSKRKHPNKTEQNKINEMMKMD